MNDDEAWRRPASFPPPFACAWGDDEFGLWAEFELTSEGRSVRQKMRWIEPGTFWMGSPEEEPERSTDEGPRHLVTLTEGFWLADTACSQALWIAIMGANPSRFKGEQLPVENVSWDDVREFLRALQGRFPNVEFELPTEAQWECACRAGTETPFSFGENITPGEVKYNCTLPYDSGVRGLHRARTVEVGSWPPNAWGLYEMHGNVREWCLDGRRGYANTPVSNPVGPLNGMGRALRGGSWSDAGRYVRSSSRDASRPGDRGNFIGFRLCSK